MSTKYGAKVYVPPYISSKLQKKRKKPENRLQNLENEATKSQLSKNQQTSVKCLSDVLRFIRDKQSLSVIQSSGGTVRELTDTVVFCKFDWSKDAGFVVTRSMEISSNLHTRFWLTGWKWLQETFLQYIDTCIPCEVSFSHWSTLKISLDELLSAIKVLKELCYVQCEETHDLPDETISSLCFIKHQLVFDRGTNKPVSLPGRMICLGRRFSYKIRDGLSARFLRYDGLLKLFGYEYDL